MEHNDLCVGIDLGTTNSVLATINLKPNGDIVSKVVNIPRAVDMYNKTSGEPGLDKQKKPTLPSCVYYRAERNYAPLVGDFAKMQYPLRPHLVAKSIKSQMGKPYAEGLSPDIPDKTPAEVSSRILRHLLEETKRVYNMKKDAHITDAVITVPANFDSVMCKATRDAAELAGIKVRNEDGSERPILLPEPNAVIYDLINQIRNGEISNHIIDLSTQKNILVFDLGGGTLDITMHTIKRREDCPEVLKVEEIATNRYTLLGGDDFDEVLAEEMYSRYLKQYERNPEIVKRLKSEKNTIMPQLRKYAEQLKIELNERCGDEYDDFDSNWYDDEEEEEIDFTVGGGMGGVGYAYDDTFTKEEIEQVFSCFMGENLQYNDYQRLDKITSQSDIRTIIYPILDVLKKAADKFGTEHVVVDAVLVNGGMSKFYMVTDRLKSFFGFDPIVALDPDQAVARGAAVYHYYLHKFENIQDDMRMVGAEGVKPSTEQSPVRKNEPERNSSYQSIEWGRNILNDSLYLGVKNGAVHKIIPTGAELPYQSEVQKGFRLEVGQHSIAFPIKSRNLDGSYRTIANGHMEFKNHYNTAPYVAFSIFMSSNKVITMHVWTSRDPDGNNKIEEGNAVIVIGEEEKKGGKTKVVAPVGSILQPKEEINNLLQLCKNFEKSKNGIGKSQNAQKIRDVVSNICNAGNPQDFAEPVLDAIEKTTNENIRLRLFVIARKLGVHWKEEDRRILSKICMNQISPELHYAGIGGVKTSANIEAIRTLSICGTKEQINRLEALHEKQGYLQCCLYTHAKTKTHSLWIYEEFKGDMARALKRFSNNIQFSAHAIGQVLKKDDRVADCEIPVKAVLKDLCKVIESGCLKDQELISCILALGWMCDQRSQNNPMEEMQLLAAKNAINDVRYNYDDLIYMKCTRACEVAGKMINGEILSKDEEEFLLTKLEM